MCIVPKPKKKEEKKNREKIKYSWLPFNCVLYLAKPSQAQSSQDQQSNANMHVISISSDKTDNHRGIIFFERSSRQEQRKTKQK